MCSFNSSNSSGKLSDLHGRRSEAFAINTSNKSQFVKINKEQFQDNQVAISIVESKEGKMKNALKTKTKKKQFKTKNERKEHSKNMVLYRKQREYLKPDKKTERLVKQRILSKRYRDRKKLEIQEKDVELSRISINKQTELVNIEALKGLGKVQKYQDEEGKKNREESARIGRLRKELDAERYDFEMQKAQLAMREKLLNIREQEIEIRENLIIKKEQKEEFK